MQEGFLFFFLRYLFIYFWLRRGLVVACEVFHCDAQASLSSCGTRAPEHVGSVVEVSGLSCSAARGILVP